MRRSTEAVSNLESMPVTNTQQGRVTTTTVSEPVGTPSARTTSFDIYARDGVRIHALARFHEENRPTLILVHMLGLNSRSWDTVAEAWYDQGYDSIAIDLRGHGLSDGSLDNFTDEDFQRMSLDVKAAKEYLNDQGRATVVIIGASIGANAALVYAGSDPTVAGVIALSPGINYHGIEPRVALHAIEMPVLFVAGRGDVESADAARQFADNMQGASVVVLPGSEHGTEVLQTRALDDMNRFLSDVVTT